MLKKMFIGLSLVLCLALAGGNVMAQPDWEWSDVFYHTVTGNVKGFPGGSHPGNNTQWIPCARDIPECGEFDRTPTGDQEVTGVADARSYNSDESDSSTGGNDESHAFVSGWSSGYIDNFASGDRYARQDAFVKALPVDLNAWSWSKDFGFTSKAGAGAKIDGSWCDVFVIGESFGLGGDIESTYTEIGFGGFGTQYNFAGEEGYNAGFAIGGNTSGFEFEASNEYLSEGQSWKLFGFIPIPGSGVLGFKGIDGGAITKGKTEVSIDPYGYNRSVYAMTQNETSINVNAQNVNGNVWGNGSVQAGISGYGGYAGGSATFNYNGQFNGNGYATTYNSVNRNGSGITATSSASSSAFADGFRDLQ